MLKKPKPEIRATDVFISTISEREEKMKVIEMDLNEDSVISQMSSIWVGQ
jgi:hypothetical protein